MTQFADFGIPDYVVTDRVARSALLFASTPTPGAIAPIDYDPANGPVPIYSYVTDTGELVEAGGVGFGVTVVEITQEQVDLAVAAGDTLQIPTMRHGHFLSNGQIIIADSLRDGNGRADLALIRATTATRESLLFSEHNLNQV